MELEAGYGFAQGLAARLAYAYIDAEDRTEGSPTEGLRLARQPRHAATTSIDAPVGSFLLGADLRYVSDAFDDARNTVQLDHYALLDLRVEFEAVEGVRLFGRVENVWDEEYRTAAGYGAAGRGAFVGVRGEL